MIWENVKFLTKLTGNNFKQYFEKVTPVKSDAFSTNSIYWYGHATTVININNKVIVTDPVLGKFLGYFKRVCKRPADLRKTQIDYVLLSHGHMDHLHFGSLRKLAKAHKNAIAIVPKGYKKIARLLGFKKVVLIKQGDVYQDEFVKITAIETNHDGRRFYVGIDNESNAYMIESNNKKIFFAGDTAYTENFNNFKCDIALMPVGCYMPERFSSMHCNPEDSYKMFKNMDCPVMIPIHYKTFKISLEDFDETTNRLLNLKDDSLKILDIGQSYNF